MQNIISKDTASGIILSLPILDTSWSKLDSVAFLPDTSALEINLAQAISNSSKQVSISANVQWNRSVFSSANLFYMIGALTDAKGNIIYQTRRQSFSPIYYGGLIYQISSVVPDTMICSFYLITDSFNLKAQKQIVLISVGN